MPHQHQHHTHIELPPISFAVMITSDSRTPKTDLTGKAIVKLLSAKGHKCIASSIVPNKKSFIRQWMKHFLESPAILIITSGGTGCSRKDITIEAVQPFINRELPGFGELFRALSYREIGSRALMSRALLGISGRHKIIVCLPGSPDAVKLALKKLLIPELNHIIWEAAR